MGRGDNFGSYGEGAPNDEPNRATELTFLRYFYTAAGDAFGPAESDVYDYIKQAFKRKSQRELPEGYEIEE